MSEDMLADFLRAFEVRVTHDPADDYRHLLHAARRISVEATATVLSLLASRGVQLSAVAGLELERARDRATVYSSMYALVGEACTQAKGGSLQQFYPRGLQRFGNDLDLVFESADDLWSAAVLLAQELDPDEVTLVLFGGLEHPMLVMRRRSAFPAEERDLKVELTTLALPGDGAGAPPIPRVPDDASAAQLLFVAEERYQRAWRPMDALDAAFLAAAGGWEAVVESEFHRADVLLSLAQHMGERTTVSLSSEMLDELSRRSSLEVPARSRKPEITHGLRASLRPGRTELRTVDGVSVLHTPIGTFVLAADARYRRHDLELVRANDGGAG